MKYAKYVILLLLAALCFSSCTAPKSVKSEVSDSQKNINELVTTQYTNEQLNNICDEELTLTEFNSKYPIECLRKRSDSLTAAYKSSDSFLIIYFNSDGTKEYANLFKAVRTKDEFSSISTGKTLDDVMKLDPDGVYYFLTTGRNEPRISDHCTSDGHLVQIRYNDKNEVIEKQISLI